MSNAGARTDSRIQLLEKVKGLTRDELEALATGMLIRQSTASHRILALLAECDNGFAPTSDVYGKASFTGSVKTRSTAIHRLVEAGYVEPVRGYRITEIGRKALSIVQPLKKSL